MRLLVHLCNQRILNYHIDHMWPMSKKIKKLIHTNEVVIKENTIEDYGWPSNIKSALNQINKSKQNISRP